MDKSKKSHSTSSVPSNLTTNLERLKVVYALSPNTKEWTFEEFTLALQDRVRWLDTMRKPIQRTNPERLNTHKVSRDRRRIVKKHKVKRDGTLVPKEKDYGVSRNYSVYREIIPSRQIKVTKRVPKDLKVNIGRKIDVKREFIASLLELWTDMGGKITTRSYYNNLAPFEVRHKQDYSTPTLKFIANVLALYGFEERKNEVLRNEVRAILERFPTKKNDKQHM